MLRGGAGSVREAKSLVKEIKSDGKRERKGDWETALKISRQKGRREEGEEMGPCYEEGKGECGKVVDNAGEGRKKRERKTGKKSGRLHGRCRGKR